jgi:hypothetical protein
VNFKPGHRPRILRGFFLPEFRSQETDAPGQNQCRNAAFCSPVFAFGVSGHHRSSALNPAVSPLKARPAQADARVFLSVSTLMFVSILSMRDAYARMFKRYWRLCRHLLTVQRLTQKQKKERACFVSDQSATAWKDMLDPRSNKSKR